jgi:hypothetical protein
VLVTSINEFLKTDGEALFGMSAMGHPLLFGDIISERLYMAGSLYSTM